MSNKRKLNITISEAAYKLITVQATQSGLSRSSMIELLIRERSNRRVVRIAMPSKATVRKWQKGLSDEEVARMKNEQ